MSGLDPVALDRWITGNYGADQYPEPVEDWCRTHASPWPEPNDQCNQAQATDRMMKHFECVSVDDVDTTKEQ